MKHALRLLIALVFLLSLSSVASAAPSIFFGEDLNNSESVRLSSTPNSSAAETQFKSNLVGVGTETFESFSNGTGTPLTLNFSGAGTATLAGTGAISSVTSGTNGYGRYPISGNNYWEVTAGGTGAASAFTINFSQAIAAFGFYGVDIGDFGGQLVLTLQNGTTHTYTVPNTLGSGGSTGGSVLYWGIIDTVDTFKSIAFYQSTTDDTFAFDNMTIGAVEQVVPTPEPMTMILLGLGMLGLAGLRKRN
jgi:hypothetical protein